MNNKSFFEKLKMQVSPETNDIESVKSELMAMKNSFASLSNEYEKATSLLKEADVVHASLTSKLNEALSSNKQLTEKLAAINAEAEEKTKRERISMLQDLLGDEVGLSTYEATKTLSNESFTAMTKGFELSSKKEAGSFSAKGVNTRKSEALAAEDEERRLVREILVKGGK